MRKASILSLVAVLVCGVGFSGTEVHADIPHQYSDPDEVLVASRICANESSLPQPGTGERHGQFHFTDDCPAIYSVLSGIAERRHISFVQEACEYTHTCDPEHPTGQIWPVYLNRAGDKPQGWDERSGDWDEVGRPAWLALLQHVQRIFDGEVRDRCGRRPDHWGCGPRWDRTCHDHERATQAGYHQISCGQTLDRFYIVPRYHQTVHHPLRVGTVGIVMN